MQYLSSKYYLKTYFHSYFILKLSYVVPERLYIIWQRGKINNPDIWTVKTLKDETAEVKKLSESENVYNIVNIGFYQKF